MQLCAAVCSCASGLVAGVAVWIFWVTNALTAPRSCPTATLGPSPQLVAFTTCWQSIFKAGSDRSTQPPRLSKFADHVGQGQHPAAASAIALDVRMACAG